MICFYGIAASYLITISVDQFYLNYRDSLFNEAITFPTGQSLNIVAAILPTLVAALSPYLAANFLATSS